MTETASYKNGDKTHVLLGSLRVEGTIQVVEITKVGEGNKISSKIRESLVGVKIPTILSWNQLANTIGGQLATRIMVKGSRVAYIEDVATSLLFLALEDPDLMEATTQLSNSKKNELFFLEPGEFRIVE